MAKYFATFPAGCYPIIERHLKSFKPQDLGLLGHDESSVIFESPFSTERLIELRFLTNIYRFIDKELGLRGSFFSLAMLQNGQPATIEPVKRTELEAKIVNDFGLELNVHLSRNNFYLIQRGDEEFLTLRLPRPKFKREKLQAGELRPELAHILCLAAGFKAKDTLLDSFAGSGAIPFEAVRGFGCKTAIAVDHKKVSGRHEAPGIKWHEADAVHLDFIDANSINRVITDPPWGIYDTATAVETYRASLQEIFRVLKQDGVTVILSGSTQLDKAIPQSEFKIIKEYPILVSGKKAKIYKLQKLVEK